jgi:hypothetical protein
MTRGFNDKQNRSGDCYFRVIRILSKFLSCSLQCNLPMTDRDIDAWAQRREFLNNPGF